MVGGSKNCTDAMRHSERPSAQEKLNFKEIKEIELIKPIEDAKRDIPWTQLKKLQMKQRLYRKIKLSLNNKR